MRLYFYRLYQPLGEKPRIEVLEYEAESETIVNQLTRNFSALFSYDGVVLKEKNFEKAAEIFKERFHEDIKRKQEKIDGLKKEVAKAYDLIDMIDDWRLEHEAN